MILLLLGVELVMATLAGNCTHTNKQPAMYGHYTTTPTLHASPAFGFHHSLTFVDTSKIQSNGVFLSNMLHFSEKGAGGGYTGCQSLGHKKESQCLFSIWDGKSQADPAHPQCHRHNNDGQGMGTQCKVPFMATDGTAYVIRVVRLSTNATGDLWESSVVSGGKSTVIGRIVFRPLPGGSASGWGGIDSHSVFYEHIGCCPCGEFYSHVGFNGPIYDDKRSVDGCTATINMFSTNTCHWNTASDCLPGLGCGKPLLAFESGPGVTRNITDGQKLW